MKFCERCGVEIFTRDGFNHCNTCEEEMDGVGTKRRRVHQLRKEREQVLKDLGLVKCKGALGGTYWE